MFNTYNFNGNSGYTTTYCTSSDGNTALGFPIEDAVKDKPSIRLKIDKMFTGLLTGFPGNNNFILTVTENNGLSTTKTLKYYVPAN